jgi:DNA-binding helix-hairpin-helix protein with protein kinase domain
MVTQAVAVVVVVIEPRLMLVLQVEQAAQDFIPQAVVVVVEMETLHILEPQAAVAVEQLARVQMLARLPAEQIKERQEQAAQLAQAAAAAAAV